MKLSVLVPTVPRRLRTFFPSIIEQLESQVGDHPVEIVGLYDNKRMTVGEKRNSLLKIARGEYITFVDDDDRIDEDYIKDILKALEENPEADCVVYDVICTVNESTKQYCRYGIEYDYHTEGMDWYGKPAHTHVWKRSIALQGSFPEANFSEDTNWVGQVWPLIKNQVRINKVLYYYDFNISTTETRNG